MPKEQPTSNNEAQSDQMFTPAQLAQLKALDKAFSEDQLRATKATLGDTETILIGFATEKNKDGTFNFVPIAALLNPSMMKFLKMPNVEFLDQED